MRNNDVGADWLWHEHRPGHERAPRPEMLSTARWRPEHNDGYAPNRPRWERENLDRILALRMEGYTLREIGEAFGVSHERVRQVLKRVAA